MRRASFVVFPGNRRALSEVSGVRPLVFFHAAHAGWYAARVRVKVVFSRAQGNVSGSMLQAGRLATAASEEIEQEAAAVASLIW